MAAVCAAPALSFADATAFAGAASLAGADCLAGAGSRVMEPTGCGVRAAGGVGAGVAGSGAFTRASLNAFALAQSRRAVVRCAHWLDSFTVGAA